MPGMLSFYLLINPTSVADLIVGVLQVPPPPSQRGYSSIEDHPSQKLPSLRLWYATILYLVTSRFLPMHMHGAAYARSYVLEKSLDNQNLIMQ